MRGICSEPLVWEMADLDDAMRQNKWIRMNVNKQRDLRE